MGGPLRSPFETIKEDWKAWAREQAHVGAEGGLGTRALGEV
jgi:hypothetical protein